MAAFSFVLFFEMRLSLSINQSYKKARNPDVYFQKHESEIILHGGVKHMLEQVGFNVKTMDISKLKAELSRLESRKELKCHAWVLFTKEYFF